MHFGSFRCDSERIPTVSGHVLSPCDDLRSGFWTFSRLFSETLQRTGLTVITTLVELQMLYNFASVDFYHISSCFGDILKKVKTFHICVSYMLHDVALENEQR